MNSYVVNVIIYLISFILSIILILVGYKKKTNKVLLLKKLNIVIIVVNLLYSIAILAVDNVYLYTLSFIGIDWLVLSLLSFVCNYNDVKPIKKFQIAIVTTIIIDNIILIIGAILNSHFSNDSIISFNYTKLSNSILLPIVKVTPYFFFHMCISYFMIGLCLLSIVDKALKAPKLYKVKNISLALGIIAIVIINFIFLMNDLVFDYSIPLYTIELYSLCYFISYRNDKVIIKNVTKTAIHNLSDSFIVYDLDQNPIYFNDSFKSNFTDFTTLSLTNLESYYSFESKEMNEVTTLNLNDKTYNVEKKVFLDNKSKIQGYYIVFHDITYITKLNKKQAYNDTHDTLTGLYNLNYFLRQGDKYIKANPNSYLLLINIVKLKSVYHFLGKKLANQMIIEFSNIIKEISLYEKCLFARAEGENFLILTNKEYNYIIDKINKKILNFKGLINVKNMVFLDFSVSKVMNNLSESYEQVLLTKDYSNNTSKIKLYNDDILNKVEREKQIINSIESGLINHQIQIYLQPQIDSKNNKLIGSEALARWIHPSLGFISPGEFIPVFEKYNLIHILDKYIWEEACKFLNEIKNTKFKELSISVNISPVDFYSLDIFEELTKLVTKYEISISSLRLEITESSFAGDDRIIETINSLRNYGFIVEMDDFGSAYSSLNSLKNIPIDILKLDIAFILGEIDTRAIEILHSIIDMSHNIGLPIIAEGVEDLNQLEILNNLDCYIIQGYFYSSPLSKELFLKYIEQYEISSLDILKRKNYKDKLCFSSLELLYKNNPNPVIILKPIYAKEVIIDYYVYYINHKIIPYISNNSLSYIGRTVKQIIKDKNSVLHDDFFDKLKNDYEFRVSKDYNYKMKNIHYDNYIMVELVLKSIKFN